MNITNEMMDAAFAALLKRIETVSELGKEAFIIYQEQLKQAYLEYRKYESADAKSFINFFEITSRCGYVGYPGDNQLRIYLPPDSSDEKLGNAVVKALAQSRIMMYEYLAGIQPQFEREEGMVRYKKWVDETMKRYGHKTKVALFKNIRFITIEKNLPNNQISLCPSERVAMDGFNGLPSEIIVINSNCSSEKIGAELRLAFGRCIDSYGKK
jgi:hypothetical protein